nr:MAG TPA: hypothetical protein [Caudoviricetes sp.]
MFGAAARIASSSSSDRNRLHAGTPRASAILTKVSILGIVPRIS